eukprot:755344-Hanusia_phi.AAC.1
MTSDELSKSVHKIECISIGLSVSCLHVKLTRAAGCETSRTTVLEFEQDRGRENRKQADKNNKNEIMKIPKVNSKRKGLSWSSLSKSNILK